MGHNRLNSAPFYQPMTRSSKTLTDVNCKSQHGKQHFSNHHRQCTQQVMAGTRPPGHSATTNSANWHTICTCRSSSSCCRSRSDKDCFHHLTVALHLSLCCESDVQESIFMSLSFRFLLMVSLNRRRGRPLFL